MRGLGGGRPRGAGRGGVDVVRGRVLVTGRGRGPLLRLRAPISLWGGVDPVAGRVVDPRHPDHGASLAGTVLAVPSAVGSSSSSAIMLELLRQGTAPAAVLMGRSDAILALGVVVARELGQDGIPVVEVPEHALNALPDGVLEVLEDGTVRSAE
jgi:predicted aconitase with swiveling domain